MADYGYAQGGLSEASMYAKVGADGPSEIGPFGVAAMAFDDALGLVNRLNALADRLCGPVPTPVGTQAGANAAPSALFSALRAGSEQAREAIRGAHQALDRIERSLS